MPSNLPSSFASAAAGQNANRDARAGRGDGRGGGGDWARRDGRTNGTLTFRRPSTTPGAASHSAAPSDASFTAETAVQTPGAASYDYPPQSSHYTKQSILDIFQHSSSQYDVADVYEPTWTPGHVNGNSGRGWGKSAHTHANQDPNSCWVTDATSGPNNLRTMNPEEKETFASDVNSPLKPPNQKEVGQPGGTNGRKPSVSHGSGPGFGLASPTSASRPGTRRRETTDASPFGGGNGLASPAGTGRFHRDDGGFILGRKGTEPKDTDLSEEEGGGASTGQGRGAFGGLMRSNTAGSTGIQVPSISSLWGQGGQPQPVSAGAGIGSFGQFALPTPTGISGTARGGSRFANLIPKDAAETTPTKSTNEGPNPDLNRSWRTRPRTDTDPFGDDNLSGSAALGGAKDSSPPPMPNAANSNLSVFETPVKGSTSDFGMAGLNLGQQGDQDDGPLSPSETNPYRSPPADRTEEHEDLNDKHHGAPAHAPDQAAGFGGMSRGFPTGHAFDGSDRSQTSSAGPKAYPNLSTLTGWPAPAPTGTPDRERQGFGGAFGNSLFSPVGEMQSPGLGSIGGGVFGPPSAGGLGGTGSIGRSKLGSLFPAAMQAQMQGHDHHENLSDSMPDLRQANPLGAIGRNTFGPPRETGSPMRSGRGMFEDLFPSSGDNRAGAFGNIGGDGLLAGTPGPGIPQSFTPGAGDLPSAQMRVMVMPDRMRWVYLDPQGNIQGPFTGLEMNDWYKANFFTADLRVKKVEDPDFEPLGQLIRRIGNSREPFLVPQIGVAHGQPSQPGPFSPANPGGVVPPLSGLFPSFGRTLTAEEQNNLERRKQEEQYAMAQQREMMLRQQAITRIHGGASGLHHHSSAHSLQSQPSFGSISSPIGAPQQGGATPLAHGSAFFDGGSGQQGSGQNPVGVPLDAFRDDELANLNAKERQMLASSLQQQGAGSSFFPPQPIGAPSAEGQLRGTLPGTDQLAEDEEGFRERLKQFEGIRAERDALQGEASQQSTDDQDNDSEPAEQLEDDFDDLAEELQMLSLTQQVQKTQAAAAAATGLPMSFPPPPPQSGTPLPAPTAQRARSNLPEQYSRSQSGTPDTTSAVEPPPLAPWAKDSGPGGRKGPSLKEIQEIEARNAAKAEEAAAATRRAALEQEAAAIREREKAAAIIATGLPTTSTWGSGSPVAAGSPWAKPGVVKAPSTLSGPSKQKTLADIQREEEARKEKAKTLAIQTGVAAVAASGKRYADLATRPGNPPGFQQPAAGTAPPPGSGWAMVGAGGKVKAPTGPAAAQSPVRSVSTTVIAKPSTPVKAISKPVFAPASISKSDAAMDEFNKWLQRELSRGITRADIDSFAADLLVLPLEAAIIADAIYANSKTMNGQHFAEEFIRRKKRAEQGIVEKQPSATDTKTATASAGGWSEVAKKTTHKEPTPTAESNIQAAGFKVVPGRKKGGKK
ncbi:GYF domain-containing protein [Plectosphaerella plurivora]|uniref:GYF domain-containing protein n=1 Tax=Plectosphaerella plurivora TaxID=936078 RepID=A0A9P8V8W3_9PEZI|nr:GYF domain-containing protein [Plectosphaerella plurivora]